MELNNLVFPAPSPTYTTATIPNLLWVPRSRYFSIKALLNQSSNSINSLQDYTSPEMSREVKIPCHFQKCEKDYKDLILYFHGNCEDLGSGLSLVKRLSVGLKANVLSIEYPGYGVYDGNPSAEKIIEDAEIVFDFLVAEVGLRPENITILGRSIGSAPAIHLAATRKPKAMILISPFTSIKDVVKGWSGAIISHLIAERFQNVEEIKWVECPVAFIHGKRDKLISSEHSKILQSNCKALNKLHLADNMTHNDFSVVADIIQPVRAFFNEIGIFTDDGAFEFPEYSFDATMTSFKTKTRLLSSMREDVTIRG